MQSTGQPSTQALSLTSMHGSTITYVMVISPSSAPPLSGPRPPADGSHHPHHFAPAPHSTAGHHRTHAALHPYDALIPASARAPAAAREPHQRTTRERLQCDLTSASSPPSISVLHQR